ncbi:prephenate dehydrogenase [Nocardioides sp.]|uniref:prephenate dehydrogenase n=1 Tax=Nocardioides sp. TaxID=35761 RepID=UPI0035B006F3
MGHGLKHPADLVAWRRWHESQHPVRHAVRTTRARLRPGPPSEGDLFLPAGGADVLVAVEAAHASFAAAVVAPLAHLPADRTAIVAPVGWQPPAAYADHQRSTVTLDRLAELVRPSVVLAAGHYTEIGAAAFALADERELPFLVSQHGALTPFAPPLPRAARLLAWSQADGTFWTSGRRDVDVQVTGSQLMWGAASGAPSSTDGADGPLTYLGQGHAAEISRARLAHAALTTCREHGAVYRPHPSERDVTSRAVLAAYERAGITVDRAGVPLVELEAPVVSVFSTGVLEAAARGRHAWVDFPRPPAWLGEFWERYGMHRLGSDPTPAPALPDIEPARRIAEIVLAAAS